MGYVGDNLLRWALVALGEWRTAATKKRGRQTFPRFLVLKRLDVPADLTPSAEFSTADFHRATEELFGIATADEATSAGLGGQPLYFNPLTGDYQRADPSSDWAVGTLWTRSDSYEAITYTVEGTGAGNQKRKFQFNPGYLEKIGAELGSKVPLLPLAVFLARRSEGVGAAGGFGDINALRDAVVARLHLNPAELDGLFDVSAWPTEGLSDQQLSSSAILQVTLDVTPKATVEASKEVSPAATPAPLTSTGPSWDAVLEDDDPCGLKGLGSAFRKAQSALAAGKHVIFYGPPGTGKSRLAECVCQKLNVEFTLTTATSDWTTFDTIGGYFPKQGQELAFMPGLLLDAIKQNRWVIIDELNRADLDKAFGQLFSILAGQTVTLPHFDGDPPARITIGPPGGPLDSPTIAVSPNWRLIGTMNTFDKSSLFQLSYALMRRFAFVEVPAPEGALLQEIMAAAADEWPKDGREDAGERLIRVFCAPTGLRSAGREVGAAIPLDICRAVGLAAVGETDDNHLLELLDMYLFPQFEGMERDHANLLKALKATLELDEQGSAALHRKLAAWTGSRP